MKKRHLIWIIPSSILIILTIFFFIYTGIYYHAEEEAYNSLTSTSDVTVNKKDSYYFFDSVSETDAIIIYPGAKVEVESYAPLCMEIASDGVDVFLIDMPFRLAFFGGDSADKIINNYNYENYYMCGHSLGGVFAAKYAKNHSDKIKGVILLGSYSVDEIDMNTLLIYGSNDLVLNRNKYLENLSNAKNHTELVIEGGNHASFAYYGKQDGDGELLIDRFLQISKTKNAIVNMVLGN